MVSMSNNQKTKEKKAFRFFNTVAGNLVLAALIWFIGFNLLVLASDTGSLLQWGGVVICLFWGLSYLLHAITMFIKKLWHKAKQTT